MCEYVGDYVFFMGEGMFGGVKGSCNKIPRLESNWGHCNHLVCILDHQPTCPMLLYSILPYV